MATLTNTGKGPRGVRTKTALVYLEPGETRDLDFVGDLPADVEENKAPAKKADDKAKA
jgi:hypothetical protein